MLHTAGYRTPLAGSLTTENFGEGIVNRGKGTEERPNSGMKNQEWDEFSFWSSFGSIPWLPSFPFQNLCVSLSLW